MDAEQLREDVRAGRIDAARLVDLIVRLQKQLQDAQRRIEELEKQCSGRSAEKLQEPFSLRAEELRQQARGKRPRRRNKPARRGRVTTAEKVAQAARSERVFPQDVPPHECRSSHTRVCWRLESGRAVLVAYEVYRAGRGIGTA